MTDITISRRQFGAGLAAGAAGLTIGFGSVVAQDAAKGSAPQLQGVLKENPQLDGWVRIGADGKVTVCTGRVELGQGVLTAMRQIAADELDLEPMSFTLISGDTKLTPNEGQTAGSQSIKFGGEALGLACADARATLIKVAAEQWKADAAALKVTNGVIEGPGGQRMSYAEAAGKVSLARQVDPTVKRKPVAQQRVIGRPMERTDIPAKVFGQQVFIHDLRPAGMLFGAVARPPAYASKLVKVDTATIKAMPGVVGVVQDGSFLGVVAKREEQARAAAEKLEDIAEWSKPDTLFGGKGVHDYLLTTPNEEKTLYDTRGEGPAVAQSFKAEYRRGFQAHASIGASCALAQWQDGKLTVWSHTQGVYPLREHIARALKLQPGDVHVIHAQGSGCYGQNGADDVALDAALLAKITPGVPVRVHWQHEQEMAWEPWGSAMVNRLEAGVSADGKLVSWSHDVWSFPHSTRPGGPGVNLRSAWYLAEPSPAGRAADGGLPNGASARNAVPIYVAPNTRVTTHYHEKAPIRTSALRTLGAYFNASSADMFMDDIAAKLGVDPVTFRLQNLKDQRLVGVLKKAVEMSGWKPEPVKAREIKGTLTGFGVGLSKYKNSDAHVAIVAEVAVDTATGNIRPVRMWSAVDVGRAINPDGVVNQIEGGIVQSTSWTLLEEGRWEDGLMVSSDYEAYPILNFTGVPAIKTEIIDKPDSTALGVGEGSQAPTAGAIANAVFAATGKRVTQIPFTPKRVLEVLKA